MVLVVLVFNDFIFYIWDFIYFLFSVFIAKHFVTYKVIIYINALTLLKVTFSFLVMMFYLHLLFRRILTVNQNIDCIFLDEKTLSVPIVSSIVCRSSYQVAQPCTRGNRLWVDNNAFFVLHLSLHFRRQRYSCHYASCL